LLENLLGQTRKKIKHKLNWMNARNDKNVLDSVRAEPQNR